MIIRIWWPSASKLRVKLKRALYGDRWFSRGIYREIKPRFSVRRLDRSIIQVKEDEAEELIRFLEDLGIRFKILREKYFLSGPKVLIMLGVNAISNEFFRVLGDEEMIVRSRNNLICLEDALVTTFSRALKDKKGWIRYVVMGLLIRKLDYNYMFFRAQRERIYNDFLSFLNYTFRILSGNITRSDLLRVLRSTPSYYDIIRIFRSLHGGEIIPETNDKKPGILLNPETIVNLASKQLIGY